MNTTNPESSSAISNPASTITEGSPVSPARAARPKGVYAMDRESFALIYGEQDLAAISQRVDIKPVALTRSDWREHPEALAEAEFVFSGWGAPLMDEEFLAAAPKLKMVFYGAGSIRSFVTDAFWARGVRITSAFSANAVPVAEYTVSVAILSLKKFWQYSAAARRGEGWGDHTRPIPGAFRATIGIVSLGMIARKVVHILRSYDVRTIVYCPFLTHDEAAKLGVEKCSLEDVFKRADVVSIHAPVLKETIGMVNGALVSSMKPDATLINTARGVILNQPEVVQALRIRPDLHAVLDVTDPEPPKADDPLFTLQNVTTTSHIAGSHGRECQRMGSYMVSEMNRYLAGQPLDWELTQEMLQRMA